MPTALGQADFPTEGSTLPLVLAFTDEVGAALTFDTLVWSLRDAAGAIVNSRSAVASGTGPSVAITLYGADLTIGSAGVARIITLEGTFTSDLGSGLPWNDEISFEIIDLRGIA